MELFMLPKPHSFRALQNSYTTCAFSILFYSVPFAHFMCVFTCDTFLSLHRRSYVWDAMRNYTKAD